jgi:hypothetical protein
VLVLRCALLMPRLFLFLVLVPLLLLLHRVLRMLLLHLLMLPWLLLFPYIQGPTR